MLPADKTCELCVKDGKVWCNTHQTAARRTHLAEPHNHVISEWNEKAFEYAVRIPFRHVLYTGFVHNGQIFVDEDQ